MIEKAGYLTVEASFLIPVTLMVIVLIIHFSFYCLDQCITTQKLFLAALRSSNQWELNYRDRENFAKEEWKKMSDPLLIAVKDKDLTVKTDHEKICISFCGKISHDEKDRMGIKFFKIERKMEATTVYPAKLIRKWKKGEKYLDDGNTV